MSTLGFRVTCLGQHGAVFLLLISAMVRADEIQAPREESRVSFLGFCTRFQILIYVVTTFGTGDRRSLAPCLLPPVWRRGCRVHIIDKGECNNGGEF